MSSPSGIKIIMGGTGMLRTKPFPEMPQFLSTLTTNRIDKIDSAVIYGDSEEVLGSANAGEHFAIDTKIPGGLKRGSATRNGVIETGRESLRKLKVKHVDVLYIHGPDETIPFEETLDGMNALYQEGVFRRLGLSNFKREQVEEVCGICERKGWVKPSVYQGNYNAFARSYETSLLPFLRQKGISFYAYSPQAGGFLSKTSELINSGKGEGRMLGDGPAADLYQALYKKPTLLEGLTQWNKIARDAGIKPGDMAVRWVRYDSMLKPEFGDALIIGGRTIGQIDETCKALEEGSLGEEVAKRIDEVWETVKGEAPVDNYHDFVKEAQAKGK